MGRDENALRSGLAAKEFQSTRPHGARRGGDIKGVGGTAVSIHAPAWGATRLPHFLGVAISVSIHAPAWGATAYLFNAVVQALNTNFARSGYALALKRRKFAHYFTEAWNNSVSCPREPSRRFEITLGSREDYKVSVPSIS